MITAPVDQVDHDGLVQATNGDWYEPNKPMNPEAKEKLLEALRSGKYTKTKDYLFRYEQYDSSEDDPHAMPNPIGYCCLGVACDISGLGEWVYSKSGTARYKETGGDQAHCTLALDVATWLGTDGEASFMDDQGHRTSLAGVNDASDTFEPVIEAIEKYF